MWTNTYTVNEYNDSLHAFSFADNTMPYKSSVVDTWSSYYFKAVRNVSIRPTELQTFQIMSQIIEV